MTADDRYLNDPVFHCLVDHLEMAIEQCQYTPSEIRDAAMLAAIHYEMRTMRRRMFAPPSRGADEKREA